MDTPTSLQIVEFRKQEQQLESAITQAPLALIKLYVDGTLVFASDDGFRDLGIDLRAGLAKPYQEQFSDSPDLVNAIRHAFKGNAVRDTVRVNDRPTDIRFFPAYDDRRRFAGVIGLITDATSRFSAIRLFRTLEVLSLIRKHLARSDSTEEFLARACQVMQEIYPAVWIGLAERSGKKPIRVTSSEGPASEYFSTLDLSWDIFQKNGRNLPAEAIRSGRTQATNDIANSPDCAVLHAGAERYGWKTLLAVPLFNDGASGGVLTIHSGDAAFDKEEISLWEKIGAEISEGISILEEREERKRILLDRQEADERYKQLVESLFDVTVVHRDGKVLDINAAGVRLAGAHTSEQLIGTPLVALIDPADRQRMLDSFSTSSTNISQGIIEFQLLALDSSMIEVESITVPIRHHGAPALLSVLRDVSGRKRQEEQLSKAKASLEYAQEIAEMGSIEYDVVSGHTEWSPSALAILGLDGDVGTKSFVDVLQHCVGGKDTPAVIALFDDIRKHAKASSAEFRITGNAGIVKTIKIHGIPEVEKRVFVLRIFFVVQDVTEFRTIERGLTETTNRLLRAQEIGRIGDFEILPDDRSVILSVAASQILGLGKTQELSLDGFYRQLAPENQPSLRAHVENAIAPTQESSTNNQVPRFSVDARLAAREHEQWVSIQGECVGGDNGHRIIGNIQDITDRKKIEVSIARAKEEVDAAQRLARVWRWEFDVENKLVTWEETIRELIGRGSPIPHMSYEQFLVTIRDVDRDAMRRAVDLSIKEGVPGSVVYVQKFLGGVSFRMWARWRVECDAAGKVTKLRGASLDVSEVREAQEREARRERMHNRTGIPEKEMAFDRICYLTELAKRYGTRFSALAFAVRGYREMREEMGEASFYAAQIEIAKGIRRELNHVDTYARWYQGRFLVLFNEAIASDKMVHATKYIATIWPAAFATQDYRPSQPFRIDTASIHCPEDGLDWEVSLKLLEHRLDRQRSDAV